jgi:hypothetical protein
LRPARHCFLKTRSIICALIALAVDIWYGDWGWL